MSNFQHSDWLDAGDAIQPIPASPDARDAMLVLVSYCEQGFILQVLKYALLMYTVLPNLCYFFLFLYLSFPVLREL